MFTAIKAETAHSPTYQLLRGEIKKRGGRSPGSGNQVIAGGRKRGTRSATGRGEATNSRSRSSVVTTPTR
jgi:hypothetical protein